MVRSPAISIQAPDSGRAFVAEWDDHPVSAEWDGFVESTPDGHHEQTSLWGQVRSRFGWHVGRVLLREHGRIVAGTQVMSRPIARFGKYGYVTYGPCFQGEDPECERVMIAELLRHARHAGINWLMVGLPYDGHRLARQLTAAGFFRKPAQFPPSFLEATGVIDLTMTPDELLARMRRHTRRNVGQALKRGIQVVDGGEADVGVFRQLMLSMCERRHITPNPPQADFFPFLWQHFRPRSWVRVFIARYGDEPVSAALAFTFRDWFRVWKVGWSGAYANLQPNDALWWGMIQWAKGAGYRHFDLVGIAPDVAAAICDGASQDTPAEGATSFKLGYGPDVRLLPGAYFHVSNPVLRMGLRCGLASLLSSPTALRLARRVGA